MRPPQLFNRFIDLSQLFEQQARCNQKIPPLRRLYQDAKRRGGVLRSPIVVMLDLTNMCNINCTFCYRSGPGTLMPKGDVRHLPLSRLDALCAQFSEMGVASITLSGGEPTCHPQFLEAVALVKKWDFSLTIVTNGTHLSPDAIDAVSSLIEPSRDKFELSFNAANRSTFGQITRSSRYDDFLATLDGFKRKAIPFLTMTLVLQNNVSQIERILAIAADCGAGECAVEAPFPKNHMQSGIGCSIEETLDLYERLLNKQQAHPFIALNFFHLFEHIRKLDPKNERLKYHGHGCHAGEASCAIDIHGNLHLCQFVIDNQATRLENLHEKSFAETWIEAQNKKKRLVSEKRKRGGCPAFEWESDHGGGCMADARPKDRS